MRNYEPEADLYRVFVLVLLTTIRDNLLVSEIIVGKLNLIQQSFMKTTFARARQGRKSESGTRNNGN